MDEKIRTLLADGISKSNFQEFEIELNRSVQPISYGLLVQGYLSELIGDDSEAELSKLVLQERVWKTAVFSLNQEFSLIEQLLFILWQDLYSRVVNKLTSIIRTVNLSPHGVVYCYFGKAELNIVIEYKIFRGNKITLSPLIVRKNPIGVLELSYLMSGSNPKQKNAIKNAVLSVDKIVYQRGAITHVNRQLEDVFGPTIDTILLAEIVVEKCGEYGEAAEVSALEIGPGSGHLSVVLANTACIKMLTTIDISDAAIHCTLKNFAINEVKLDAKDRFIRVRAEQFSPSQLKGEYHLVICNPPYLPATGDTADSNRSGYSRAAGTSEGLSLCNEILSNLTSLLSADGELLLMTSSVTHEEVIRLIPTGFSIVNALSQPRRVPLDVDTLWEFPDLLNRLIDEKRVEKDAGGAMWHQLIPIWIKRNGTKNVTGA